MNEIASALSADSFEPLTSNLDSGFLSSPPEPQIPGLISSFYNPPFDFGIPEQPKMEEPKIYDATINGCISSTNTGKYFVSAFAFKFLGVV